MICSRCSRGDGGDVEIPTKKLKPLKMISKCTDVLTLGVSLVWLSASLAVAEETPAGPHAVENPLSPLMIAGDWVPDDPCEIDFAELPRVPSQHVVVSDVRKDNGVNQHNYLVHHAGKFWAMWSDGPGIEDRVGQRVKFSTSSDGLAWSEPKYLTPEPPNSGPDSPHYATRSDKRGASRYRQTFRMRRRRSPVYHRRESGLQPSYSRADGGTLSTRRTAAAWAGNC
jgi:hypothetical protein